MLGRTFLLWGLLFTNLGELLAQEKEGGEDSPSLSGVKDLEPSAGDSSAMVVPISIAEVVQLGYGSIEKTKLTGAVSSLPRGEFNEGLFVSPEQLLQGRIAGAQINTKSGEPGAGLDFIIRGYSSVAGNQPLIVVDGFPLPDYSIYPEGINLGLGTSDRGNSLNFLNPADIERVDVLKDAAATAIYGARAANGVVMITTKSGKGKEHEIRYSSRVGISETARRNKLLGREQYLNAIKDLGGNVEDRDHGANTDWQEAISRQAVSHEHVIAYVHQYNDGNYRASLGFIDQEGVLKNSSLERITASLDAEHRLIRDRLKVGAQLFLSRLDDAAVPVTNNPGFAGDLLGAAYTANPTWPADPDTQLEPGVINPLALLKYSLDNTRTYRNLLKASLDYQVLDHLSLIVNAGLDHSRSARKMAISPDLFLFNGIYENGRAGIAELETSSKLLETYFNYQIESGESAFTAIAGYSYQQFNKSGSNLTGWGFADPDKWAMVGDLESAGLEIRSLINTPYQQFGYSPHGFFYNRLNPEPEIVTLHSQPKTSIKSVAENHLWSGKDELQSFFGRLHYGLSEKYFFSASLRTDGSTRFGENYRYGYFPSVGVAWRLSEEAFLPESFNELKLRVSYGISGNQSFPYQFIRENRRYSQIIIQNNGFIHVPGLGVTGAKNPDAKWEQSSQVNVGVDFEAFKGRLSGSLDLYKKVGTDLFLLLNAPQPSAQPFVGRNVGVEVVNKGVELAVHYEVLSNNKGGLSFGVLGAYNDNVLENFEATLDAAGLNGQGLSGAFVQRIVGGQPLYSYYLRESEGFDQNGLEIFKEDAASQLNKSPFPKYTFGFITRARYQNWDLSANLYGQSGNYIYNNTANAFFTKGSLGNGRNVPEEVLLSEESPVNAPNPSTRFLEKGDFLRMQNLSLGYTFTLNRRFIERIRISGTGENLFVLTSYSGLDPEVNINMPYNGNPSVGIDYTPYPRARTFSLGLSAMF